ncbi:hypothetical protein HDV05_006354 [Chytridiales sp. JEL 0842]|nr:hypothetical protein HDV05_006354 [Chytridiales sp. JEL 0842]
MFSKTIANKLAIAVAKGDGIGPEIMDATIKIFEAAKIPLKYHFIDMGKSVYLSGKSNGMTDEAKETVERCGILFKGPMETPKGSGVKSINVTARKVWNTYSNKRVFLSLPGVETVFSRAQIPIDLTLFRENIEDTYGGIEHMQSHDVAQCRRLITRPGSLQVHRMAFDSARAKGARRVTCCHKANIMKQTDGLFLESFYEVAASYPEIKADDIIVDDLAMKLVMNPQAFDVIVLPNLQGDIISDLCAGLVGGLGMAPSANIGEKISIFEAVHGTAPDIAGKGLANPTALILSGLMMLRYLGLSERAQMIQQGLEAALAAGERTKDLVPLPGKQPLKTDQFADAIIRHMPPAATQEMVAVNWTYEAPEKPAHNVQRITPRSKEIEKNVGMDIFVDSDLLPHKLAETLQKSLPDDLKLTMLSNRGTQVWPTGSLFTELVNHYRCRIEQKVETTDGKSNDELLGLAAKIAKDVRICSIEMLLKIGDKKGYSLAQGQ